MRVFITGADGMLGSVLIRLLLAKGHEVTALVHPDSRSKTLDGLSISKHTGCILHPETFTNLLKGKDAVIHAAASVAVWPSKSEMVRKVNIDGTRNVIDAVLTNNVKRLIYIGSGSSVNSDGASNNKDVFADSKSDLDYISSKHEALKLVLKTVKEKGLPALAVLPTFMIGPYDSLPGSGKMVLAIANGTLKCYTKGGRNFVATKDVATAIANSLEIGEIGKCYVAGNENLTYKEFFSKVATIVGKPEPALCVADWMVKSVGFIGDVTGRILRKPPVLSYPMAKISCKKQFVANSDAIKELNMPQTKIEEGILECYNWFLLNGYLDKR